MLCPPFLVFQAVRACGSHTLHFVPENFAVFIYKDPFFRFLFFISRIYT